MCCRWQGTAGDRMPWPHFYRIVMNESDHKAASLLSGPHKENIWLGRRKIFCVVITPSDGGGGSMETISIDNIKYWVSPSQHRTITPHHTHCQHYTLIFTPDQQYCTCLDIWHWIIVIMQVDCCWCIGKLALVLQISFKMSWITLHSGRESAGHFTTSIRLEWHFWPLLKRIGMCEGLKCSECQQLWDQDSCVCQSGGRRPGLTRAGGGDGLGVRSHL